MNNHDYYKPQPRKSRGLAIKDFCYECMGAEIRGGKREGIRTASALVRICSDTGCPLYRYRYGKEDENV